MCIRQPKLTNKSLLCVPQLYVVWSKYPHVCMDRKYNRTLSLTLSSNSKGGKDLFFIPKSKAINKIREADHCQRSKAFESDSL